MKITIFVHNNFIEHLHEILNSNEPLMYLECSVRLDRLPYSFIEIFPPTTEEREDWLHVTIDYNEYLMLKTLKLL